MHAFRSRVSVESAERLVRRTNASLKRAALFPLSGGEVREFGSPQVRQLVVEEFRVIYQVHTDSIEVLAVVHGSVSIEE